MLCYAVLCCSFLVSSQEDCLCDVGEENKQYCKFWVDEAGRPAGWGKGGCMVHDTDILLPPRRCEIGGVSTWCPNVVHDDPLKVLAGYRVYKWDVNSYTQCHPPRPGWTRATTPALAIVSGGLLLALTKLFV